MHGLDMLRVCTFIKKHPVSPFRREIDRAERKRKHPADVQFAAKHFWPQKNWPEMPSLHKREHHQLFQSYERVVVAQTTLVQLASRHAPHAFVLARWARDVSKKVV